MGYESRPVCDKCWTEREGDRTPVRMLQPDEEVCYFCGDTTRSGIYMRLHEQHEYHEAVNEMTEGQAEVFKEAIDSFWKAQFAAYEQMRREMDKGEHGHPVCVMTTLILFTHSVMQELEYLTHTMGLPYMMAAAESAMAAEAQAEENIRRNN